MTANQPNWDIETDVLIFGSGVAGFSAAIFARKQGLRTLVCEKMPVLGGTTATAGGFIWVPNTEQAKAAGAQDSVENARTYLEHELGNYFRGDLVDAFLEAGPKAVAEIQNDTAVGYDYVRWPDYHADQVGGVSEGRTLEPRRFDGRRLGKDFELVRPPIRRLMLLGGMSIDKRKVDLFLNPFQSVSGFFKVVATFARYASDRLLYSRGTDIGGGNAVIASMLYTLRRQKADIWVNAPLEELVSENGKVVGAIIRRDGHRVAIRALRGVILGTGGFPHNAAMRMELGPKHPHNLSVGWEGNLGEGINAARRIGAVIDYEVVGPGLWQPSSLLRRKDGSQETILYGYLDRGKPGVIAVDLSGRRFVNESNSYHDIGEAMFKKDVANGNRFFFICDRAFVWRWGLGLIRPYRMSLRSFEKSGYITTAATAEELARRLGVDATNLAETIRKNNISAETGIDPDFKRGTNPFNAILLGDPKVKPNPNLGPIGKKGPLVALEIFPSTLGTSIGLKTNAEAQVIGADDAVIEGLYASGQDISPVMRGFYPGGGINIGPAMAFSYIAIRNIVARA